ncbi:hypothetical protein [Paraherbaspirillum soli]|uniref:Uncharacterized protein n=1 Tax=Paraherbaspirillum soli TaxID=631222 RepID=A0ABW0M9W7_9BURK
MKISNLKIILKALSLTLALSASVTHAETINIGSMLKDGIKKALQKNPDSSANAGAGNIASYPMPGSYDATDRDFERSLTIHPDGKFELEAMEKGKPGNLRSGSGSGQLVFNGSQWRYAEGTCTMTLSATSPGLQVHLQSCAGLFGDVPFDGRYQLKEKKTTSVQANSGVSKNKQLSAQLNCQNLDFSETGIANLLGKATKLPQNEIWEHEIVVPGGYTFGDIPIQSVNLSEVNGGFLALFVDGDSTAIKSAIKKVRIKGDTTTVGLHKVGEANGFAFPGKRSGQLYVFCRRQMTEYD